MDKIEREDIYTLKKAKKRKLIQVYKWQSLENSDWLKSELNRIRRDKTRTAIIVEHNSKYSLFVDDISKKHKKS